MFNFLLGSGLIIVFLAVLFRSIIGYSEWKKAHDARRDRDFRDQIKLALREYQAESDIK